MDAQRPNFIYPPGSMLMHSPLILSKADMYGFFMKGKMANLQCSIDKCLNQVAGSTMYFKVLSPYVLTSFTRVDKAYSEYPEDRDKGWIQETDIVTWVMVGRQIAVTVTISAMSIFIRCTYSLMTRWHSLMDVSCSVTLSTCVNTRCLKLENH